MSNTITVYFNGNSLLVRRDTAIELGLKHRQRVSQTLFWEIIRLNAKNALSELDVLEEAKTSISKPENIN